MDALVETSKPPESIRVNTSARLEPGIHATGKRFNDIMKSVYEGNLDVSIWDNKSRTEIIKQHPRVLGIDSLFPITTYDENGEPFYTREDKKRVRAFLPASPSELNDKKEVLVVAGDIFFQMVGSDLANSLNPSAKQEEITSAFSAQESKARESGENSNNDTQEIALNVAALVALAAGVGWGVSTAVKDVSQHEGKNTHDYLKKALSRRALLRTAGGLGAAGLISKYLGASKSLKQADSGNTDIFEKIVSMVQPRTFPDKWVRGRTALVLAKSIEASNSKWGDGSEAIALFGKSHELDNKNYESDQIARKEAIGDFYQMHADLLEEVCKEFGLDRNEAFTRLKKYIASSDLLMVSGSAEEKPSNPDEFIEKNVQFIKRVESPEVMTAIKKRMTLVF